MKTFQGIYWGRVLLTISWHCCMHYVLERRYYSREGLIWGNAVLILNSFYDKKFREKKSIQIFLDFKFFFETEWHLERSQKFDISQQIFFYVKKFWEKRRGTNILRFSFFFFRNGMTSKKITEGFSFQVVFGSFFTSDLTYR